MSYFHAINGQGGSPEPTPSNDHPPVLLWTNPSPTSEFNAQTVSLDLTEYVGVIVEFITTAGTNALASRLYCKKTDTYGNLGAGFTNNNSYARNVLSVNNTGIEFGNAIVGTSQTNNTVVPMKIYGVKEYVVEPVSPITKELLWTNPSPTSEFGAFGQINYVEADLTNYEYVLVEYRKSTTDATTSFFMNKVSELPSTTNGNQNGLGSSGSGYGICRPVSKNSSNKLGFEGAFAGQTSALNACIPVKVYGINGLAV